MKVRLGFVSNSSSSSFVVLLPQDWTPTDEEIIAAGDDLVYELDLENEEHSEELFVEKVRNHIRQLKSNNHTLWEAEAYDAFSCLEQLFINKYKDVVIASAASGPDDGKIISADRTKLRKLI